MRQRDGVSGKSTARHSCKINHLMEGQNTHLPFFFDQASAFPPWECLLSAQTSAVSAFLRALYALRCRIVKWLALSLTKRWSGIRNTLFNFPYYFRHLRWENTSFVQTARPSSAQGCPKSYFLPTWIRPNRKGSITDLPFWIYNSPYFRKRLLPWTLFWRFPEIVSCLELRSDLPWAWYRLCCREPPLTAQYHHQILDPRSNEA